MSKAITIGVHGYNHDPDDPKHRADREGGTYDYFQRICGDKPFVGVNWYSGRSTVAGRWRAMRSGFYLNTYKYAFCRLVPALVPRILEAGEKAYRVTGVRPNLMCHSLGTLAGLYAAQANPELFGRVLLLNGSAPCEPALTIMENVPGTQFLNIAVEDDDIVRHLGGWFAPGLGYDAAIGNGLLAPWSRNVRQIYLDDTATQQAIHRAHGWTIRGDNPDSFGDHNYSYEFAGNYPLYRDFLFG